ncbi:hypothetical protein VPH49_22005 [Pseudomonas luteola]|uniref:hypothetical protein n=1 Tax=Pseudomonas luteola TaxID=47886 RepID=UPI003A898F0E
MLSGVVTASGSVAASATATGKLKRQLYAAKAKSTATGIASASVQRTTLAIPEISNGDLTATGEQSVSYLLGGSAAPVTAVAGTATASYLLAGTATGTLALKARVIRATKVRGRCATAVSCEADGQIWSIALAAQVVAQALPFATTDYVGTGHSQATATIVTGAAERTRNALAPLTATAVVSATGFFEAFAQATATPSVTLFSEMGYTHQDLLTLDASGTAPAQALPTNTEPDTYTASFATASGEATGEAYRTRPGAGQAKSYAQAKAFADALTPGRAEAFLSAEAVATAASHREAHGTARIGGTVVCLATARLAAQGKSALKAQAVVTKPAAVLRIKPKAVSAKATTSGVAQRVALGDSQLGAQAQADTLGVQLTSLVSGLATGEALPEGLATLWPKILVSGEASGLCVLAGAININALTPAPPKRTLTITGSTRLLRVLSQTRNLAISGSSRRTAA